MFGMGPMELVLIFGILLLLFGGSRLPGVAAGIGGAIRSFRGAMKEPEEDPKLIEKNEEKS